MSNETPEEAAAWVDAHADRLAVRAQVDGRWGSFWLSELPEDLGRKWRSEFIRRRLLDETVIVVRETAP